MAKVVHLSKKAGWIRAIRVSCKNHITGHCTILAKLVDAITRTPTNRAAETHFLGSQDVRQALGNSE